MLLKALLGPQILGNYHRISNLKKKLLFHLLSDKHTQPFLHFAGLTKHSVKHGQSRNWRSNGKITASCERGKEEQEENLKRIYVFNM